MEVESGILILYAHRQYKRREIIKRHILSAACRIWIDAAPDEHRDETAFITALLKCHACTLPDVEPQMLLRSFRNQIYIEQFFRQLDDETLRRIEDAIYQWTLARP
ncbi:hypothetical protein JXA32_17880 [Candidatus Sumerlaeota bacterium]|nr:hypothetical protein [Candidatus Sumerlaeota bacterium]